MATQAGWQAARAAWEDPQGIIGLSSQAEYYDRLWAYYNNTAWAKWSRYALRWEQLRGIKGFYRDHRNIMNPTYRLVKFYRDSIYKGPLSLDGENLPDGTQIAIPFGDGTKTQLKLAIAQIWEWSGWQQNMLRLTTVTPALGNLLAEVMDLPWQGKVVIKLWKPHYVKDISLDEAGNPKYYCIEYVVTERNAETGDLRQYNYKREVDTRTIRTYKNNEPFDYSNGVTGAEWAHPYGFAPARWFRHMTDELESDYGVPAVHPVLDKIDELNELVSQGHDQLGKIFGAPLIIKGAHRPGRSDDGSGNSGPSLLNRIRRSTSERERESGPEKEKINYVYVGPDGGAEAIELSMSEALEWVKNAYLEIEADLPELGFPRRLSDMSSITGPAATRVLRDVVDSHLSIQANYDHETRRLMQMAVAIAGYNLSEGIWAKYAQMAGQEVSYQQQRFVPFNIDSYKAGDLDYTIVPRPLITATDAEKWQARLSQAQAIDVEVNKLSVPEEEGWEELGKAPEKIKKWLGALDAEKAQQADAMAALQQANTDAQQQQNQGGEVVPAVQK